MTHALPVTTNPATGESIESWLERLADLNGITTAHLLRRIRNGDATVTRFLTLSPSPQATTTMSFLARIDTEQIRRCSLAVFDGIALDLTGLDPARGSSFRKVAARGWFSAHGTTICPHCLHTDGQWRLSWRLPIVTTCSAHRCCLLGTCVRCGRVFRDQQHSHLRPSGASSLCDNPIGAGPTRHCEQNLVALIPPPALPDTIAMQRRVDAALYGAQVQVLGHLEPAAMYLADLRYLSTLLLHLADRPGGEQMAPWAVGTRAEAVQRDSSAGTRWGIRPPAEPGLRAQVLATADEILRASETAAAARTLRPWIALTPATGDGPLNWWRDHTTLTPALTRLLMRARPRQQRVSHRIDAHHEGSWSIDPRAVPQLVPHGIYQQHLSNAADASATTVRLFASLCLARTSAGVTSWAEAAEALDLPGEVGTATARACAGSLRIDNIEWLDLVQQLPAALTDPVTGARENYRALEATITHRRGLTRWHDRWAQESGAEYVAPSALPCAIHWQWLNVAHGHPEYSPAWRGKSMSTTEQHIYRVYENNLTDSQKRGLRRALWKRA